MNILTKISVVVLVLLVVISSVVFITLATQMPNYRDLYEGELARNKLLSQANRHANVALRRAQMETGREKGRAVKAEGDLAREGASLRAQLDEERGNNVENKIKLGSMELAVKKINDELAAKERRNQGLVEQLAEARAVLNSTSEQLRTTNDKLSQEKLTSDKYKRQAESHLERITDLEAQIEEAYKKLAEKGRAVPETGEKPAGLTPPGVTGTVTAVKGNLASVNVGSIKGIKPGMEMMIYRGGEFVAYLQIQDVDTNQSGGVVVKKRLDPMVGDKVESIAKER